MPITINDGGVLRQLSKVSTNDGGILKPIYGTPKDNLTLHWGGFTGISDEYQNDFLIGEFTIDCPTYVNLNVKSDDGLNNQYMSIPSDIATQLGITSEQWGIAKNFKFAVCHTIKYKLEKSVNPENYHRKYSREFSREFSKDSNGSWVISKDTFTKYNSLKYASISLDENKYYVYVHKYAYLYTTFYDNAYHYITKYLDFSGMTLNTEFNFQTLNGG